MPRPISDGAWHGGSGDETTSYLGPEGTFVYDLMTTYIQSDAMAIIFITARFGAASI